MWLFALIPVLAATAGAVYVAIRPPSDKVVGAIQHFAAGVIFYAAAGELLPDATHNGSVWLVVAGGGIGIAAMLLLDHFAGRAEGPVGLSAASAVDALIDEIVLGLGFAAGQRQGMLLAIALAVEFLFLGLSLAGAFGGKRSKLVPVAATAAISLMVPAGVFASLAVTVLPTEAQTAAYAFGLVALLFLVTEELLVEAHEKPETPWGTRCSSSASWPSRCLARRPADKR